MSPSKTPDHYSKLKPQPIEVIEAWELGFHLGNVLKYIARAPHKEAEIKDLKKAKWYLERFIDVRLAANGGFAPSAPPPQE